MAKAPKTATLNIDKNAMRQKIDVAIRRVSAFVRFGLDGLEERNGGDFSLSAGLVYSFWPKEIPEQSRDSARNEYASWLVGNCLRELDLFYGLFLDDVWHAIEIGELHGNSVRSNHKFDQKFSKDTNIRSKQGKVAEKIGCRPFHEELESLSFARNSLTHNAGVVRSPNDCNDECRTSLSIKWSAFDLSVSRDGETKNVASAPFDTPTLSGEGPIWLGLIDTPRELVVPSGSQIKFTNSQIAELSMFYKLLGEGVINNLDVFLAAKGILPTTPEITNRK